MSTAAVPGEQYPQCSTCPLPETLLRLGEADAATAMVLWCHRVVTPAMQASGVKCPAAHQLGISELPYTDNDDGGQGKIEPPAQPEPGPQPRGIRPQDISSDAAAIRLGQRLRQARLARNLTQADLAQQRFNQSYIDAVERGRIRPSLAALEKLSERLKAPLAALLRDEEGSPEIFNKCDPNCPVRIELVAGSVGVGEGLGLEGSVVQTRADQGISITCARLGGATIAMSPDMPRQTLLENCSLYMDLATQPQSNPDQGGNE